MAGGTQRPSESRLRRGAALPSALGLILLTLGLMLTPSQTSAASGWELILDRPTPAFQGIDFVSNDEGWLVAGGGILHTTDGGATWQEAAKITAIDIDFADAAHGWAVGYGGTIYATADGGGTWSEQVSGTSLHLSDVFALSPSEAFAVGSSEGFGDLIELPFAGALVHTADGGTTWNAIELPPNSWFSEINFVGDSGWAAGKRCGAVVNYGCPDATVVILRTADRGQTWTASELDDTLDQVRSLTFLDESTGWAIGVSCGEIDCESSVITTNDGGATWQRASSPPGMIADLVVQDEMNAWAVTQTCELQFANCELYLQRTNDGGKNWTGLLFRQSPWPTNASLYVNAGVVYIPSDVLRSTDGGASFQTMQHPALSLSIIDFVNANIGFGLTTNAIFSTADSGRTWDRVGTAPILADIMVFLDSSTGFIAGYDYTRQPQLFRIFRTDDGGESWRQVHTIDDSFGIVVFDMEFSDDRNGWIALDRGAAFTDDGGETWIDRPYARDPDASRIVAADLASLDEAWVILGRSFAPDRPAQLAHTKDRGRTWQIEPPEGIEGLQDVEFVDADYGWYTRVACDGSDCELLLFATSDGGATWHESRLGPGSTVVHDLIFVDPVNGWTSSQSCFCRGGSTSVAHTADGGRTWQNQLLGEYGSGDTLFLGSFDFVDAETGWFLLSASRGRGPGGGPPQRTLLYQTTDGGGGPIGVPPTPTVQLPNVGGRAPDDEPSVLPLALLLSGVALALGAGGLALARRRSRG